MNEESSSEKTSKSETYKESTIVGYIINAIRSVVIAIVLFLWTFIGFIIWIPLLTRMIAYFTGMVTMSAFRKSTVKEAQNRLNFAVEFYINGFKKILDVLKRDSYEEIELKDNKPLKIIPLLKSMALDIAWTLLFWAGTILMVYNWWVKV